LKEDQNVDGRMTLKRILQEEGKRLQTGFKWLRIMDQWGNLVQNVKTFLVPQKAEIFMRK
jgi:hypothetical protein